MSVAPCSSDRFLWTAMTTLRSTARLASRRGYTLIELMIVVAVMSILTASAVPKVGETLRRARVHRAASVVAADLERAFSLAARGRRPIVLSCTCENLQYRANDASGNTLRFERSLANGNELNVVTMTFQPASVTIVPSGRSSQPLTVTIASGGISRRVTLSTAGLVRITS